MLHFYFLNKEGTALGFYIFKHLAWLLQHCKGMLTQYLQQFERNPSMFWWHSHRHYQQIWKINSWYFSNTWLSQLLKDCKCKFQYNFMYFYNPFHYTITSSSSYTLTVFFNISTNLKSISKFLTVLVICQFYNILLMMPRPYISFTAIFTLLKSIQAPIIILLVTYNHCENTNPLPKNKLYLET